MAKSANRSTNPIESPRTSMQMLNAHILGAGAANPTLDAQEALNGEILSAVRVSAGVYTITFRYVYPELKSPPVVTFGPAVTAGLNAYCSAIDITNTGIATLSVFVGTTPTDIAVGDVAYLTWSVRNSGKNK